MLSVLEDEILSLSPLIKTVFGYIFPEYPAIGLFITAGAFILFVVYLFKSGFRQALKISLSLYGFAVMLLICVHYLGKLFKI